MKRLTSRVDRFLRNRFPSLYYNLIQRPKIRSRFKNEKRLARGEVLSQSRRPSILFFTTQKCASQYVNKIIEALAVSAGMQHADYDAYAAMVRVDPKQNPFSVQGTLSLAFKPQGYYYGPIGTFRELPMMAQYKVLLQLRDPRDVLTSLYFSTAYSHAVISPKLIRRRKEAREMDIDQFVLQSAEEYLPIYRTYCERLLKNENVLFVKYEDMVARFDAWLQQTTAHMGLNDQVETLKRILGEADFSVQTEDKFAQRRQIAPGDYKRKLQKETIAQLNEIFSPILNELKYKQ